MSRRHMKHPRQGGWTKVIISDEFSDEPATLGSILGGIVQDKIMLEWAAENCSGDYFKDLDCWKFENEEDATLFTIRWA